MVDELPASDDAIHVEGEIVELKIMFINHKHLQVFPVLLQYQECPFLFL